MNNFPFLRSLCDEAGAESQYWGPFLEGPGNLSGPECRSVQTFSNFSNPKIQDGDLKSFENYEMKVSAKETKWTCQGPSTCFSIL